MLQTIMLVCGPLLGVWLTAFLGRAKELRQWQRDRSLKAYTDVLRLSDSVVNEAHRLYVDLPEDRTAQLDILFQKISEFNHAACRATLLAPIEMSGTIRSLVTVINNIVTNTESSPKMLLEEWRKLTIDDRAVITTKFSNEAWQDLREQPSAIREWWKKIRQLISANSELCSVLRVHPMRLSIKPINADFPEALLRDSGAPAANHVDSRAIRTSTR